MYHNFPHGTMKVLFNGSQKEPCFDVYYTPSKPVKYVFVEFTVKDPPPVADSVKKTIEKMMLQRVDDWALRQIMMRGWFPPPPPIEPPYKKMLHLQF